MRGQMGNMGWTGRDAGPHHHWWRRASAPAILTYLKAHRYQPDAASHPDYTDGFAQGVKEAYEHFERMAKNAENHSKNLSDLWNSLPSLFGAGTKDSTGPKGGDVKYPSADELGKRLDTGSEVFHRVAGSRNQRSHRHWPAPDSDPGSAACRHQAGRVGSTQTGKTRFRRATSFNRPRA